MALKQLRIPTLTQAQPIVETDRKPTTSFLRTLNDILKSLGDAVLQIQQLPLIQEALANLDAATQAAQAAADAANAAAGDSSAAAAAAAAQAAANAREASLQASYIDPASVLTADTINITIAPHTRIYPSANGGTATSVSVAGGTVTATGEGDTDYVSYSDRDREGGTVTYVVSTTAPAQTGATHVVGAVMIPATGTVEGGEGPQRPGFVRPRQPELAIE